MYIILRLIHIRNGRPGINEKYTRTQGREALVRT